GEGGGVVGVLGASAPDSAPPGAGFVTFSGEFVAGSSPLGATAMSEPQHAQRTCYDDAAGSSDDQLHTRHSARHSAHAGHVPVVRYENCLFEVKWDGVWQRQSAGPYFPAALQVTCVARPASGEPDTQSYTDRYPELSCLRPVGSKTTTPVTTARQQAGRSN